MKLHKYSCPRGSDSEEPTSSTVFDKPSKWVFMKYSLRVAGQSDF